MYRALHEPEVPGSVPDPLAALVARALSKDPARGPPRRIWCGISAASPESWVAPAHCGPNAQLGDLRGGYDRPSRSSPRGAVSPAGSTPLAGGGLSTNPDLGWDVPDRGSGRGGAEPARCCGPQPRRKAGVVLALLVSVALAALLLVGVVVPGNGGCRGSTGDSTTPVKVEMPDSSEGAAIARIRWGTASCIAAGDGSAYCWGANGSGHRIPGRPVLESSRGGSIGCAEGCADRSSVGRGEHACALDDVGRAYCWGSNDQGQLGTAQDVSSLDVPIEVSRGVFWQERCSS